MKQLLFTFLLISSVFCQERFVNQYTPAAEKEQDGLSWETAWESFADFDINDHDQIPPGSIIKVAPGEYTIGHPNYIQDGLRAILLIYNNYDITIIKHMLIPGTPGYSDRSGDAVVLKPANDEYKRGIHVQYRPNNYVRNITIQGLCFEDFLKNALKFRGGQNNYVDTIKVRNCYIRGNTGLQDENTASVIGQFVYNLFIINTGIDRVSNIRSEMDGIYIDDCSEITINNNRIMIENNNNDSGPGIEPPHIDCIQLTKAQVGSNNVTVKDNDLYNRSYRGEAIFNHRQGLYISNTSGHITVFNNIIKSKLGSGLLHVWFNSGTTDVSLYNNTLYAESNQPSILQIHNTRYDYGNVSIVKIKNNIIFKNNSLIDPPFVKFTNIPYITVNNNILNNNLYYLGSNSSSNYRTAFDEHDPNRPPGDEYFNYTTQPWNGTTTYKWEVNGRIGDPEFESPLTDLRIKYTSAAKNVGVGLWDKDITQDYFGNSRPYWSNDYDAGAFEIEDTQLKVGVEGGASNTERTFRLTAFGTYWEKQGDNWNISSDQSLLSVDYIQTGFNEDPDTNTWLGFEYKWLLRSGSQFQTYKTGAAFYKFSVWEPVNEELTEVKHFYLDLRDAVTQYSPNIYIKYFIDEINEIKVLQYLDINKTWRNINDGDILRIWDIRNGNYNVDALYPYWENALVQVNGIGQHPRLIWGPTDAILFEIQTKYDYSSWQYRDISSGLEYIDLSILITSPNTAHQNLYYRVRKDQTEEYTNEVQVLKPRIEKELQKDRILNYSLYQNYPNPFNPATVISFTLAEKQYIKLKLYDITGTEVKILADAEYDAGIHNVEFNGSDLSSGVYFYRIIAGNYIETKKLQLLK